MPTQNILVEDYKKLQLQFVIRDSCDCCANAISYAQNRCASCCSNLNSLPLQLVVRCAH